MKGCGESSLKMGFAPCGEKGDVHCFTEKVPFRLARKKNRSRNNFGCQKDTVV
jgi:hypothetical protein